MINYIKTAQVAPISTDEVQLMTLEEALSSPTISVPDAGRLFFGIARNAAYDAAKRGDFDTIEIGGRIVVPVAPLAAKLGLRTNFNSTNRD